MNLDKNRLYRAVTDMHRGWTVVPRCDYPGELS